MSAYININIKYFFIVQAYASSLYVSGKNDNALKYYFFHFIKGSVDWANMKEFGLNLPMPDNPEDGKIFSFYILNNKIYSLIKYNYFNSTSFKGLSVGNFDSTLPIQYRYSDQEYLAYYNSVSFYS